MKFLKDRKGSFLSQRKPCKVGHGALTPFCLSVVVCCHCHSYICRGEGDVLLFFAGLSFITIRS